jgi:hypothetical protein
MYRSGGQRANWNFFASLGVGAIYGIIPPGLRLRQVIPDP